MIDNNEKDSINKFKSEIVKSDRLNQINGTLSVRSRLEMRADRPVQKSFGKQADFLGFKLKDDKNF